MVRNPVASKAKAEQAGSTCSVLFGAFKHRDTRDREGKQGTVSRAKMWRSRRNTEVMLTEK